MFLGRILCRVLKNAAVVEHGLKFYGEEGSELVSSYSSFEVEINDNFEGEWTMSGIKHGKRKGPEGEVLDNAYCS